MRHLVFAALFLCTALSQNSSAQTRADNAVNKHHVYIDDDDQRSLADLRFNIESTNQQNLRITVSALGPNVEPIAGFRGVSGGNRYTAEELGLVLDGHHKAKVITLFEDGHSIDGRILEGTYGTLAERRLLPNGQIDFLGRTPLRYPLNLIVDPQTKSSGRRTTLVIIDDQARLRCRYSIVDGKVRDMEVQSLGHDNFLASNSSRPKPAASRFMLTAAHQNTPPVKDIVWDEFDTEGKWVQMIESIRENPAEIANWVSYLQHKEEYTLLEWLAVYEPDAFKSYGVIEALIAADAPQWVRVAAWHNNGPTNLGHGVQEANRKLLFSAPAESEHWLATHQMKLDNWSALSYVFAMLKKDKFAPRDSSRFLPPLQIEGVFAALDYTGELADYGARQKAETGVVYTHQVVRAINGVPVSGRRTPQLLAALRKHATSKNQDVQIAALLAHTYLMTSIPKTDRLEDLVAIVDNKDTPNKVREAALMAVSYHQHPSVLLKLHQIAANPSHGAWNAAISRLGDIGRTWSGSLLQQQLKNAELTQSQQTLLADAQERLQARSQTFRIVGTSEMSSGIIQAVFAEKADDPNAKFILDAVLKRANKMTDKKLTQLKSRYDFKKRMQIWLPCDQQEFAARVAEVRSAVGN